MDLGLCLMDTPHPSQPRHWIWRPRALWLSPTRTAARNRVKNESRNIIAAPPEVSPPSSPPLRDGVQLSRDPDRRFANCATDNIPREWEPELGPVIERMLGGRA